MILPSNEEIQAAHVEVETEGTEAETTMGLAQLALQDPHLLAFVDNVCKSSGKALGIVEPSRPDFLLFRSAIMGALIGGLNLGIRIGEARAIDDVDEDEEENHGDQT